MWWLDHILTLQQALAHYERMLSQSHPNYLSHLRLSVSKAKSGSDKALVTLTTVSLGVLCVQTLIGEIFRSQLHVLAIHFRSSLPDRLVLHECNCARQ